MTMPEQEGLANATEVLCGKKNHFVPDPGLVNGPVALDPDLVEATNPELFHAMNVWKGPCPDCGAAL